MLGAAGEAADEALELCVCEVQARDVNRRGRLAVRRRDVCPLGGIPLYDRAVDVHKERPAIPGDGHWCGFQQWMELQVGRREGQDGARWIVFVR